MNREDFLHQLKRHEGYRDHIYLDTTGVLTGGWGHAFHLGSKLPMDVAELLLWHDLKAVERDFATLQIPLDPLDTVREYVIKNMLYNLGLNRFSKFKRMIAALHRQNYSAAADEMLDSKWAMQVGSRAVELSVMMRTGVYQGQSYLKG